MDSWVAWLQTLGIHEIVGNTPINRFVPAPTDASLAISGGLKSEVVASAMVPLTPSGVDHVGEGPWRRWERFETYHQARRASDGVDSYEIWRARLESNYDCPLRHLATKTVPGDGNPDSRILLMGEAPGAQEDLQGIPFCGESGQLLTAALATIGLNRACFFVTNSIFWRPPGNRKPTEEEIAFGMGWHYALLPLLRPKFILAIGATAALAMLGEDMPMHRLRRSMHRVHHPAMEHPIPCAVTYHPSYLLRQPSQKKEVWIDLQNIKHFLRSS